MSSTSLLPPKAFEESNSLCPSSGFSHNVFEYISIWPRLQPYSWVPALNITVGYSYHKNSLHFKATSNGTKSILFRTRIIFFSGLNFMKFCSRFLHQHPNGSHASKISNNMSAFSIMCCIILDEFLTFLFWLIKSLSYTVACF